MGLDGDRATARLVPPPGVITREDRVAIRGG
jgi:hypothetical protein